MNDGLRDVISIAAEIGARRTGTHGRGEPVQVQPVQAQPVQAAAGRRAAAAAPQAAIPQPAEPPAIGRSGLRMAFWLCGFHEAAQERQRAGETLSDREQSLLALSAADFAEIRPRVVHAALLRLHDVVHNPALLMQPGGTTPAEMFALETVRNLTARARETLETGGADAALSLFGAGPALHQPLAIFQAVFSTTLAMVESFQGMTQGMTQGMAHGGVKPQAGMLDRLADALDAEVGRI